MPSVKKCNDTDINDNIESEPERKEIEEKAPGRLSEALHFTGLALQSTTTPPTLYLPRSPVQLLWHSLAQFTHSIQQQIFPNSNSDRLASLTLYDNYHSKQWM